MANDDSITVAEGAHGLLAGRRQSQRAGQRHRHRPAQRYAHRGAGRRARAWQPDLERQRHVQLYARRFGNLHRQLHLPGDRRRQPYQQHRHRLDHRHAGQRQCARWPMPTASRWPKAARPVRWSAAISACWPTTPTPICPTIRLPRCWSAGPAHGNLTLNANGTFSYTHDDSEFFDRQLHLPGDRRRLPHQQRGHRLDHRHARQRQYAGGQCRQHHGGRRRHGQLAGRRQSQRAGQRHRHRSAQRHADCGPGRAAPQPRQLDAQRQRHLQLHARRLGILQRQLHLPGDGRRQPHQQHGHRVDHHHASQRQHAGGQRRQHHGGRRRHNLLAGRRHISACWPTTPTPTCPTTA